MKIQFKDGHEIHFIKKPMIKITGILSSDAKGILKGVNYIYDKTLNLNSVTFFDYGEKVGLVSTKKTVPKDSIEGVIYTPSGAPYNEEARRISDLTDIKKEICRIKGSWLDKILINGVIYFDIEKLIP